MPLLEEFSLDVPTKNTLEKNQDTNLLDPHLAEVGLVSWHCSLCAHCIPLFLKFQISKEFCTAVLQARRFKEDFKNFSDVTIAET